MRFNINTLILKGFDKDQTQFLLNTFEYLSSIYNIDNRVTTIDTLNISLTHDDFLVLLIDELSLQQIVNNSNNREFFVKKDFRNNQVLLILDGIDIQSLPDYIQYFQTFTIVDEALTDDDDEISAEKREIKSNLFEVVNDMVHYIKRVKSGTHDEKLTVYIGPADDNTTLEYQKITRELLHRNYNIVPEVSNPSAKELIDNIEFFKNMLQSADLSIHFIGHNSLLNYPEKTSTALKINEIAASFCQTSDGEHLQRIIYIPAEKSDSNSLLGQKILQFKSNTQSLFNAELVQTPIEKFKDIALNKLSELSQPFKQTTLVDEIVDDIYIMYPPGYEKDLAPYFDWFEKNKIPYSKSQVKLDQLDLLNYHQKKLTTCKGVAIYNAGNSEWLKRKLSDVIKSPGWGRKKPFAVKAILGLNPESELNNKDKSYIIIDNNNLLEKDEFKKLLTE